MSVNVFKVAEVLSGRVVVSKKTRRQAKELASVLTSLGPAEDAAPESGWSVEVIVGSGDGEVMIAVPVECILSRADLKISEREPVFIDGEGRVIFFRSRLLMPERPCVQTSDREEALLRAKKLVYDEELELVNLRKQVANAEAALEYRRTGPKREPIADDVKLVVWARDGGACVRCGSTEKLHFDHVIPVVKGGGNSPGNIQILCEQCNLKKSDKIAF
jgi:hypothetical protein